MEDRATVRSERADARARPGPLVSAEEQEEASVDITNHSLLRGFEMKARKQRCARDARSLARALRMEWLREF